MTQYLIAVEDGEPRIVREFPESDWVHATHAQEFLTDEARKAGRLPRELWYGLRPIDDVQGLVRRALDGPTADPPPVFAAPEPLSGDFPASATEANADRRRRHAGQRGGRPLDLRGRRVRDHVRRRL